MNSIPLLHLIDAQVMAMPKMIELIHPLLSFSFSLFPPFLHKELGVLISFANLMDRVKVSTDWKIDHMQ